MNTAARAEDKATLETVIEVQRLTDTLLIFKTTRPQGYAFTPGQYARLGLEANGNMVWRAYSHTAAPADDFLEFYSVLVPDGLFTTVLKDIRPGDKIWVERALYGFMTISRFEDGEDLWMLSTGTGLGPFVSMLRDPAVWQKFRRLIVVHGVRHADEFSYQEEMLALGRNPPGHPTAPAQLQLIQSVTRDPSAAAGGSEVTRLQGRITTLLENGTLEQAAGLRITPEASRIMLCGNPQMIEDMRKLLHARGLRPCRRVLPGQFVTENYW